MSAARAAELRNQLRTWDRAYYLDDAPVVDDATYDVALRELRALEAAQPHTPARKCLSSVAPPRDHSGTT